MHSIASCSILNILRMIGHSTTFATSMSGCLSTDREIWSTMCRWRLKYFDSSSHATAGSSPVGKWIDASSRLAPSVTLPEDCYIGPACALGFAGFQHADWSPDDFAIGSRRATTVGSGFRLLGFGVISSGTTIGREFRGDFHIVVGEDCAFGDDVVVEYGARIYDRCKIGNQVLIGGFVCNDAVLGDGCVVQGSLIHRRTAPPPERASEIRPGAFVGTNALVIGGVTIGDGSVVAAGAVVLSDTEPGFLYAGVPARKIRPATWT